MMPVQGTSALPSTVVRVGQVDTLTVLSGSVDTPFLETICPKYGTSSLQNGHLIGFKHKLAIRIRWEEYGQVL